MQRIKILDSCRGLAALIVVFHHVYTRFQNLFKGFPDWLQKIFVFISDLNVQAVLFFFFLSGFSICLNVKNELPVSKNTFNNYTYRRLKRILPLYYFSIGFTLVCGLISGNIWMNDDFSIRNLLGNISFLQNSKSYAGNWFAPYGDNGPFWSLSFEMFYYFLLPVFLWFGLKIFRVSAITPFVSRAALIASFTISIVCILINTVFFFPYIAFAGLFYVWFAGYFVAAVYQQKNIALDKNFFLLLMITIVLLVMNYASTSATLNKLLFGSIMSTAFFLLYLLRKNLSLSFVSNIEGGFNFLFHAIGKGSYALYLLHYPILMILRKYEYLKLWQLVVAISLVTVFCIGLERYFVSKKWLLLKLQFIK